MLLSILGWREITVCLSAGVNKKESGVLRNYAEIMIMDTGPGIDESKLEKIFERFYQASAELSSTPIGFGIGLNLCRLLVGLHHGTVVASNRKDVKGSCFTIRIPLGNNHLKKEEMVEHSLENRMVLQSHPYELEKPEKRKLDVVKLIIECWWWMTMMKSGSFCRWN